MRRKRKRRRREAAKDKGGGELPFSVKLGEPSLNGTDRLNCSHRRSRSLLMRTNGPPLSGLSAACLAVTILAALSVASMARGSSLLALQMKPQMGFTRSHSSDELEVKSNVSSKYQLTSFVSRSAVGGRSKVCFRECVMTIRLSSC